MAVGQRTRADRFASLFLFSVLLGFLAGLSTRRQKRSSRPYSETTTVQNTTTTMRTYHKPGRKRISEPI